MLYEKLPKLEYKYDKGELSYMYQLRASLRILLVHQHTGLIGLHMNILHLELQENISYDISHITAVLRMGSLYYLHLCMSVLLLCFVHCFCKLQ